MKLTTIWTVVLSVLIAGAMLTQANSARAGNVTKVLHRFTGGKDGGVPIGGLIIDAAGNLYGTTTGGGNLSGCQQQGCGTVFELIPQASGGWKEKVLHNLSPDGTEGAGPYGTLVFDSSGNLYGTASEGGDPKYCSDYAVPGCGVVFELSPTDNGEWKEKVLYSFKGTTSDGALPDSGLVFDAAGNLYGTTASGGLGGCQIGPCGVVFRLTHISGAKWSEKVIHRFRGGSDGGISFATLILDKAGNLYGTTELGATSLCRGQYGCGVVFELTPASHGKWKETILHRFTGGKDGAGPDAGLIFDAQGNLYGTAGWGGAVRYCDGNGCGVVFELSPSGNGKWEEKVLHSFTGGKDGATPVASLIFDAAGNLYGTASGGGNPICQFLCGVAFRLTPSSGGTWKENVLHSFADTDGAYPESSLTLDPAGNLFGTTIWGGYLKDCSFRPGCGVVFEIMP